MRMSLHRRISYLREVSARCSFHLIGQCEGLKLRDEQRYRFSRILFIIKSESGESIGTKLLMKQQIFSYAAMLSLLVGLGSCGSGKIYLDSATPQEQAISPMKITDETQNSVIGNRQNPSVTNISKSGYGAYREKGFVWDTGNRLAVSPDGSEIAYISFVDDAPNIMIKKPTSTSASTQRTFRRAQNVAWANDGNIYYNDNTGNTSAIGSVNAHKGSLVRQLTNNNNDWNPVVSKDGEIMYFTRYDSSGPFIWSLNLKTGELSNCSRGFDPCMYGDDPYKILCARNSMKGNTEIWLLDLKNGNETVLLSDSQKGFTSPAMSPDGKWILVVGNSLSSISKKQNTDIYAVRPDGTQLTQITYHPEIDTCPTWSPDGKYIYFISSRANKDRRFNIWRINNPLY